MTLPALVGTFLILAAPVSAGLGVEPGIVDVAQSEAPTPMLGPESTPSGATSTAYLVIPCTRFGVMESLAPLIDPDCAHETARETHEELEQAIENLTRASAESPESVAPANDAEQAQEPPGPNTHSMEATGGGGPIRELPPGQLDEAPSPDLSDPPKPAVAPSSDSSDPGVDAWRTLANAMMLALPSILLAKLVSLLVALLRQTQARTATMHAIVALLEKEPGLHHSEISRRLARGNGVVEHALLRLLREHQVTRIRSSGYTCYFLAGTCNADTMAAAVHVRGITRRQLLGEIAGSPKTTLTHLAARVGLTTATAHHHVRRMVDAGLVFVERQGRLTRISITELGHRCLGLLVR